MRAALLSRSKYFHIWLRTEALISSYHWPHDTGSEGMTTSVLTFVMMLDAILADSREVEDEGWIYCGLSRPNNCRNVKGTIIEFEKKIDDINYSVWCKRAAVFWIYISSNLRVRTLYLSDSPSIQFAHCRP